MQQGDRRHAWLRRRAAGKPVGMGGRVQPAGQAPASGSLSCLSAASGLAGPRDESQGFADGWFGDR